MKLLRIRMNQEHLDLYSDDLANAFGGAMSIRLWKVVSGIVSHDHTRCFYQGEVMMSWFPGFSESPQPDLNDEKTVKRLPHNLCAS